MAENTAFDGNEDSVARANGANNTSFSTSIFVEPTNEEKKANGDSGSPDLQADTSEEMKRDAASLSSKGYSFKSSHSEDKIPEPYAGMPKEVLLHYSRQAKYVWARNILTALVILTILALIALVIAIIVISPPCLDFWQTSPIYQIYPKSFKNSDSDSYGDLKGIAEKLDYLNDELGVKVLWLNPVYKSPQVDNGYDISDYRDIDELFGTMEDMENLIIQIHNRGMKLVMDFVPNHSSDRHYWFQASSNTSHEEHEKYKDYYVWVDGVNGTYPNNWQSEFNNASAWTWNEDRQQYYFHGFYPEQPDLNLRNPKVRDELLEILRFWFDKGVDGFRCDAIAFMLEAEHLRDNPVIDESKPLNKDNVYPDYTQNYVGVHDIVAEWKKVFDEYSTEPGVYRFMEAEVYADIPTTMRYYGTEMTAESDFPMNFLLVTADPASDWNANSMRSKILEWMRNMPSGKWPNWVVSNHDNPRLPTRVGSELARCAAVLILTLPGTPCLYYGDEIAMEDNTDITAPEDFRDPARTPMQWNVEENAGFCQNCTPWLPVNKNYLDGVNVQNQSQSKNSDTSLPLYKSLISLRNSVVFQRGYLCMLSTSENTLIYVRELSGVDSMLIAINFDAVVVNLNLASQQLPTDGKVEFYSGSSSSHTPGDTVPFNNVMLDAQSGIVLSFSGANKYNKMPQMSGNCFIQLEVCYNNALDIVQTC